MSPARARKEPAPPRGFVDRLIHTESLSGLVLLGALGAAMLWANVATSSYQSVWFHHFTSLTSLLAPGGNLQSLIDATIMTVFFLVAGLEVGRERAHGSLADTRQALAPVLSALGGMAGAAALYVLVTALTGHGALGRSSWGVPTATDIAFALGALTILGAKVVPSVRSFVLALAIADDVFAVIILAFVAASKVNVLALCGAAALVTSLFVLRRRPLPVPFYLGCVAMLWWLLAEAGIEPILAGALVGMLVPVAPLADGDEDLARSPSARLERVCTPLAAFFVLPLFVLANAGVSLAATSITSGAPFSVFTALVVARPFGKLIGIMVVLVVLVRLGIAKRPEGANWRALSGAAVLCGIGFTVPLLFAEISFRDQHDLMAATQLGLLAASVVAFVGGVAILWRKQRTPRV